jgi:site-specific DNA-methyltransferase (adenine-specific)
VQTENQPPHRGAAYPRERVVAGGVITVHHGDCLDVLAGLEAGSVHLAYADPPFNTGVEQRRVHTRITRDPVGTSGFGGRKYRRERSVGASYADRFGDYLGWLLPRVDAVHRVLHENGSFFLHLDAREVHYAKVALDDIFGRENFRNEIIWAYDYGARSRSRWSAKHDSILWYTRNVRQYTFRFDDIDRIPYMAPKLVGPEKAAKGKTPTDVWWHTIVSPTGKEKTGYPTQKPLPILERIVRVHSHPGDVVLDPFAGSGTTGEAAAKLGRDAVLIDDSAAAVAVMQRRLDRFSPTLAQGKKNP